MKKPILVVLCILFVATPLFADTYYFRGVFGTGVDPFDDQHCADGAGGEGFWNIWCAAFGTCLESSHTDQVAYTLVGDCTDPFTSDAVMSRVDSNYVTRVVVPWRQAKIR